MSIIQAIILGIVQGITEFLPVSSSGHLAIIQNIFHIQTDGGLFFDVMLHLGTLVAIFVVYRKDILRMIVETVNMCGDIIYNLKSYIQNQILGRALLESVLFYDGKCIFSSVSIEEMNFYGVTGKELGGVIEQLRLTDGVEVAIFLYETDKNEYKVSLRSKKKIDVARIAADFGGGGHVRAAGFSAKGNVHSIVNKIGEMIEQQYNEDNA